MMGNLIKGLRVAVSLLGYSEQKQKETHSQHEPPPPLRHAAGAHLHSAPCSPFGANFTTASEIIKPTTEIRINTSKHTRTTSTTKSPLIPDTPLRCQSRQAPQRNCLTVSPGEAEGQSKPPK